jgi:hypothetical protein
VGISAGNVVSIYTNGALDVAKVTNNAFNDGNM